MPQGCLAQCWLLTPVQVVEDGYEFFAKRQLVTLFSAPNYCGEFDNAGAMMSVDETLMCSFQVGWGHCQLGGRGAAGGLQFLQGGGDWYMQGWGAGGRAEGGPGAHGVGGSLCSQGGRGAGAGGGMACRTPNHSFPPPQILKPADKNKGKYGQFSGLNPAGRPVTPPRNSAKAKK